MKKIILFFLSSLPVALFLLAFNKNYDNPLLSRVLKQTFICENDVTNDDWQSIANAILINETENSFTTKVQQIKLKHPESCDSEVFDTCENLIAENLLQNHLQFKPIVETICVLPLSNKDLYKKITIDLKSQNSNENINEFRSFILKFKNIKFFISDIFNQFKKKVRSTLNLYDREIKINYLRYDGDYENWTITLLRPNYNQVNSINRLLNPYMVDKSKAVYRFNLKNFSKDDDLRLYVAKQNEKDMHGLHLRWKIGGKSELWVIENGTKVYEDKSEALKDFEKGRAANLFIYYYRSDQQYDGWGLLLYDREKKKFYNRNYSLISGTVRDQYLIFKINSSLIGIANRINFRILNKDPSRHVKQAFTWKFKKNNAFHIIQNSEGLIKIRENN